jgi:hypothetical protein
MANGGVLFQRRSLSPYTIVRNISSPSLGMDDPTT